MGCREKVAMFQNIFLFKNKIVQIYKYGIIAHSSPLLLPLSPAAAALCQWEAMTRSGGDWEPMGGREIMWPGPVLPLSAVTASLGSASTDRRNIFWDNLVKYFWSQRESEANYFSWQTAAKLDFVSVSVLLIMSCVGVMYQPYSSVSSYLTSSSAPAPPPAPPSSSSPSSTPGYPGDHLVPLPLKRELSDKVRIIKLFR